MFNERITKGLTVAGLCLAGALGSLGGTAGPAAAEAPTSLIGAAAVQLAAQSDVFGAASAGLQVAPANMAGSCPRTYMLQVNLGAFSPGTLSYQIETLDGRVSQTFRARTQAQPDGSFAAVAEHPVQLAQDEEGNPDPSRVVFSAPTRPAQDVSASDAAAEPTLMERLFGTAETEDPSDGLLQQSFRVRITAPNEVASPFNSLSVSCTPRELASQTADSASGNAEDNGEDQRDNGGRDKGRDDGGRDDGGRDSGRDSGADGGADGGGAAGSVD